MNIKLDIAKRVGRVGSDQSGCGFKMGPGQLGYGSGQVDPYFSHEFFFFKENNIYLPFGKLCNKLFEVKCITLNSPLIARMSLVKLINTYSIILKLYQS